MTNNRGAEPALSTLVAQASIAHRIELDNEFEAQLARSGFPGLNLPVVFWPLLRHVDDPGTTIAALREQTGWNEKVLFPMIGGVERWGYVDVRLEAGRPIGSSRNIALTCETCALGGIRTPDLLIRRSLQTPSRHCWSPVGRWSWVLTEADWQRPLGYDWGTEKGA
ncbi:hypothetical protein [Kribbella sp. NPDC055071]